METNINGFEEENVAVPSVVVLNKKDVDQIEDGAEIKMTPPLKCDDGNYFTRSSQIEKQLNGAVKFFSKLFEARQMAHIFHLQVNGKPGSGWEHIALNEFYDGILPLIDDLIETYQGQYGVVDGYEIIENGTRDYDSLKYIKSFTGYLSSERSIISKEDTHLHNIIDEIVALSYKTIFKLTNMK